jgi:hypothetical protein
VVEPDYGAEPKWRGVFNFKGIALQSVRWYDSSNNVFGEEYFGTGADFSSSPLADPDEGVDVSAVKPGIGFRSDGEVTEWFCDGQFVFRHRVAGMETALQFVVPFLAGFAAFAVHDVLVRKRGRERTRLQNSQDREMADGDAA